MIKKGDLQSFLRRNKAAWQFADKACDDYLLARLGLLNGLWSGFEMATQATEKLLKAYLLITDTSLKGQTHVMQKRVLKASQDRGRKREKGHDVEACLTLAMGHGFVASSDVEKGLKIINEYYERRYPSEDSKSFSSSELNDIDETVFSIWDEFSKIRREFYLTSGVLRPVYGIRLRPNMSLSSLCHREFVVLTSSNAAYASRRERIEEKMTQLISEWYPRVQIDDESPPAVPEMQ
jgi:hypothetical protein